MPLDLGAFLTVKSPPYKDCAPREKSLRGVSVSGVSSARWGGGHVNLDGFAMDLDVREIERMARDMGDMAERQLPFARVMTATRLAKIAVDVLKTEQMPEDFDNPVRWTLNAFRVKPATKKDPRAEVAPRAFGNKSGATAWDYLETQASGGKRDRKRFEKRLAGQFGRVWAVPARGVKLNKAGNISKGEITKILSGIGALGDQSATAASAKRNKARKVVRHGKKTTNSPYFVGRKRAGGRQTIYQLKKTGKSVKEGRVVPVLNILRRAPTYSDRFDFEGSVRRSFDRNLNPVFQRAMQDALRTVH